MAGTTFLSTGARVGVGSVGASASTDGEKKQFKVARQSAGSIRRISVISVIHSIIKPNESSHSTGLFTSSVGVKFIFFFKCTRI